MKRLFQAVFWSVVVALCAFVASCSTPAPLYGHVEVSTAGVPAGFMRYDGDTFVARGAFDAQAYVRFKGENGFYAAGPVSLAGGRVFIHSKSRDVKLDLEIGAPWPAWIAQTGLFTMAELEAYGITLEQVP